VAFFNNLSPVSFPFSSPYLFQAFAMGDEVATNRLGHLVEQLQALVANLDDLVGWANPIFQSMLHPCPKRLDRIVLAHVRGQSNDLKQKHGG
jgi:hypothetical protein